MSYTKSYPQLFPQSSQITGDELIALSGPLLGDILGTVSVDDLGAYYGASSAGVIAPSGDTTGETDTAAFQAVAAQGGVYTLLPETYGPYYLKACVHITQDSTGFSCLSGQAKIIMLTGAGEFDLAAYDAIGYENAGYGANPAPNHAAFYFYQASNCGLNGLLFEAEAFPSALRCCIPCVFDECEDIFLTNCSATAFDLPYRGLFSVRNATLRGRISNLLAHDCGPTTNFGSSSPAEAQVTVLELDGQATILTGCQGLDISNLAGIRILFTGTAATQWGQQTDVFNDNAAARATGHTINGVYGEEVGELIDIFSSHNTVSNVRGRDIYSLPIKIGHGGSFNTVDGVSVYRTARGVATVYGDQANVVEGNRITNVIGQDVGYHAAAYAAGAQAFGFTWDGNDASWLAVRNNHMSGLVYGAIVGGEEQMRLPVLMQFASAIHVGNSFTGDGKDFKETSSGLRYFAGVQFAAGDTTRQCWPLIVRDRPIRFSRYDPTGGTLSNGDVVPYSTLSDGVDTGWNVGNYWVSNTYADVQVSARLRISGTNDRYCVLAVMKNGVQVGFGTFYNPSAVSTDVLLPASVSVRVVPGDQIQFKFFCNLISTGAPTSITSTGGANFASCVIDSGI